MKNLINLILGICIVTSFYSCKKADVGMNPEPSFNNGPNVIQSAPATGTTAKSMPGNGLGELSEWLILGTQHTEVHLEEDMVSHGGKIGSGPAGKFKLEDDGILNSDVYLHSGVKIIEIKGTINGSFNENQNLAHLDAILNRVSDSLADLAPTVTVQDVNTTTTILGNGTNNVINMHKLNLDHTETLILSGNSGEHFIINIADGMELKDAASIITAGGARSSNILINILGHDKKGKSTATGTLSATILAPDSQIEVGNLNGQVISGGKQVMTVDGGIYNYVPFGS